MPIPPPKPSSEGHHDRQVIHETGQIIRALRAKGPLNPDALRTVVGGTWWEQGRFDRALALAVADGLVHRTPDGDLAVS